MSSVFLSIENTVETQTIIEIELYDYLSRLRLFNISSRGQSCQLSIYSYHQCTSAALVFMPSAQSIMRSGINRLDSRDKLAGDKRTRLKPRRTYSNTHYCVMMPFFIGSSVSVRQLCDLPAVIDLKYPIKPSAVRLCNLWQLPLRE